MTTDFTAEEAALKTWFRAGTKITQVLMENEPRPMVQGQWGVMKIAGVLSEGSDSVIHFDSGGERLPRTRAGRILSLTVAVESFNQTPALFAMVPLERLRATALHPRMIALLAAAQMAFVSAPEIVNADYAVDQRLISRYEMNARVRWGFTVDGDTAVDAMAWIERVTGTGTYANPTKTSDYDADSTP